ncbi:MAG: hypothetical protein ACLUKN_09990 [Bacilli bacterium]
MRKTEILELDERPESFQKLNLPPRDFGGCGKRFAWTASAACDEAFCRCRFERFRSRTEGWKSGDKTGKGMFEQLWTLGDDFYQWILCG